MKLTQISLKNLSENGFPFSSFNFINTLSLGSNVKSPHCLPYPGWGNEPKNRSFRSLLKRPCKGYFRESRPEATRVHPKSYHADIVESEPEKHILEVNRHGSLDGFFQNGEEPFVDQLEGRLGGELAEPGGVELNASSLPLTLPGFIIGIEDSISKQVPEGVPEVVSLREV